MKISHDDDDDDDDNNNSNNNNGIQRCNLRFFTISSLLRELSPTRTLKWPRCNYVQHIKRLSRATCRVMRHVVQRDSSVTKFDRV